MRGIRPLAFVFGVLVWLVFVWLLGLLAFFSPSSRCVSFLFIDFIDDLGTPPTRRPYSWKKMLGFSMFHHVSQGPCMTLMTALSIPFCIFARPPSSCRCLPPGACGRACGASPCGRFVGCLQLRLFAMSTTSVPIWPQSPLLVQPCAIGVP